MHSNTCHPDTFQALFMQFAGALRRFLYYKSGNWDNAEDYAQEAFLRMWKNCKDVPPEKAKSFLYAVANNLFLDEMRHNQVKFKFQNVQAALPEGHAPAADFDLEAQEFQEKLEKALAKLPEGQRLVFLMNRVEKMTYSEIAEHLELSVKA
ncbi:MAG: RNA polymerase sigma factor, partial [Bacteroidetes bacterium]|nr:RNA polymerase sigma factor [Bacteroidota bacterium]